MGLAAIGFREHTGWAMLAIVAGGGQSPRLLHRGRLELCDAALPRQAFHAVAELGAPREIIAAVERSAREHSLAVVRAAIARGADDGHRVVAAGVSAGRVPPPGGAEAILRVHARMHGAEREMFRAALAHAAAAWGLSLTRFPQDHLYRALASRARLTEEQVRATLAQWGREAGTPWRADEKDAAAAAWLALVSAAEEGGGRVGQSGRLGT